MYKLDLDIEQFWKDDEIAHMDNCFSSEAKQVALGIRMSDECVFAELQVEGTPWAPMERNYMLELTKRYNDKSEKIVGKRLLPEELDPEDAQFPYVKRIGEVFGGEYMYVNDTEWLTESAQTAQELEKLLDYVDSLDIRRFMLPENWDIEKKRIFETYGIKPKPMRHIRGPVTLACSIMGAENLIFLILDKPGLAKRFSQSITDVILKMSRVMDEEAGVSPNTFSGFSFADDNCSLLNPEMYELFGYPVLKQVFEYYSPRPDDKRYQHSDSEMEHLLPILGRLALNGVNFGPTVLIPSIRKYLPNARIDGCISPMTFMNNDEEKIVEETMRDCNAAKKTSGVNISTAGSINNGSMLTSMKLIMAIIQNYGRV